MALLAAKAYRMLMVLSLALVLLVPRMALANPPSSSAIKEEPTALAMAGDLFIARPVLLVITAIGTLTYVLALPFTLAAGSVEEAGDTLVMGPAKTTFVRCLGCTKVGYREKIPGEDD